MRSFLFILISLLSYVHGNAQNVIFDHLKLHQQDSSGRVTLTWKQFSKSQDISFLVLRRNDLASPFQIIAEIVPYKSDSNAERRYMFTERIEKSAVIQYQVIAQCNGDVLAKKSVTANIVVKKPAPFKDPALTWIKDVKDNCQVIRLKELCVKGTVPLDSVSFINRTGNYHSRLTPLPSKVRIAPTI